MKQLVLIHLAIAIGLLAAAVAGYAFVYLKVKDINERVARTEMEIWTKEAELANIRDAQNALATLTESEARIKGYFVPVRDAVGFLEEVGSTGSRFGADVSVLGVTDKFSEDGRGLLTLSIQVQGSFSAIMRTVGTLEFAPYDIVLTDLSLDEVGSGAWNASATYEVGTRTL